MNTKGLVELIVLNIGLDAGVLTPALFTAFVMVRAMGSMLESRRPHSDVLWSRQMALFTTFLTSPLVSFILRRRSTMSSKPLMSLSRVSSPHDICQCAFPLAPHPSSRHPCSACHCL